MKQVHRIQDIFLLSGLFYCDMTLVVNYKLHLKELACVK